MFPPPEAPPEPCQELPPEQSPELLPLATILPFEPIVRFPPTIKIIKPPLPLSELFALPEVVSLLPRGFPTPPEVAALWSVAAFPPGPVSYTHLTLPTILLV